MKDWKKVKLGTLLTESKVLSEEPSTDRRLRVKLNVLGVEKRPVTKDKKGATRYYTRKAGQFVYGKQNLHKGAFGIVPKELDGFESSLDIPAFDIDKSCYPEWIFYFFKKGEFYLKLESLAKGVGSKRIHPKQIFALEIFLPSKVDQRKVLDEIEKAEKNNQELVSEIDSQEENLTKLRQSILQDAIKGNLTQEWRKQNLTLEHASELLKKIKIEKKQLIKDRKIRKEKGLPKITKDEIPFNIPETWEFCRMFDISEKLGAGSTPKGGNSVYVSDGIMFFRSQNIYNDGLKLDNVAFIPNNIHERMKGTKVCSKDILLNITGGSIGRSTLIPDDFITGNVSQHVAIVRMVNLNTRQFIHNLIISPYFQSRIMDVQVGVSREGLSMTSLKSLLVPFPPIAEQKAIVEKVNQLLTHCDVLEQEIKVSKTNAEKLMQSILSELLGTENKVLAKTAISKNEEKKPSREIKYNSKTVLMDLVKLLKENGRIHAEDLWKMSKYPQDIDAFYAELKIQIEKKKTIKESEEKGYLELV